MKFTSEMEGSLEGLASRVEEENEDAKWILNFRPSLDAKWKVLHLQSALRYFKNSTDAVETLIVTPVSSTGRSIVVKGIGNINTYRIYDSIGAVEHESLKRIVRVSELLPEELPFTVQAEIVEESSSVGGPEDTDEMSGTDKYYRIIREFCDDHGPVTFRARLLRESPDAFKTMEESKVISCPYQVEFDMVCKSRDAKQSMKEYVTNVLAHAIMYMQWITETNIAITKEEQDAVLQSYDKLVDTVVVKRYGNQTSAGTPSHHFLAPKPITMEQIHVSQPGPHSYGVQTVWSGYTVTEKADGERMLLFIDDNGHGYMINNTFDVIDTGLRTKKKQLRLSLMDGEYIAAHKRRDKTDCDMFVAFDGYFLEGKSIMDLPLMNTGSHTDGAHNKENKRSTAPTPASVRHRYAALQNMCDKSMWDTDEACVELSCKEHILAEGRAMMEACKQILDGKKQRPYDIDGMVFTPARLSVFGYYPGVPVPIPENARWDRVLKWKPADQNTIDFLVRQDNDYIDPVTKKQYRRFKLFTGYNSQQWEHISPLDGMKLRYDRHYANSRREMRAYRARLFSPFTHFELGIDNALVPVLEKGMCVCMDGSVIENNTIVEFGYTRDPVLKVSERWVPLRLRDDKTRIFQRTQHISKTANDLVVAANIWRSIHAPVTKGMLTGDEEVPISACADTLEERILGTDDVYYARDIPRQHMLSVHMLNFHNQGIKKMLYQKPKRKDALLELACGMAGDLHRWRDGGYRFILGVDLVKDNITNPRTGAYARMLKQRRAVQVVNSEGIETTIYPDMVFVVGDCSKPLHTAQAADGLDDESKKVIKALYNRELSDSALFKYVAGRAGKGFTAASCMFAIHYFFENEEKLDGFLYNVSHNLRRDGVFIATFMDGEKVSALLDASDTGIVEGRKHVGDGGSGGSVPVWAIIRRYGTDPETMYGRVVEVFLENTNRLIPEYLVSLELLVEKAKQHGLVLEETHMFSHTFAGLRENVPSDPQKHTMLDKDILALEADPVQTQFSFLNRYVVFRKAV